MRNITKSSGNSILIRHCIYTTITVSALYVHNIVSRSVMHRVSRFAISVIHASRSWRETRKKQSLKIQFLLPSLFSFFFSFYIACALCSVSLLNNNSCLLYTFGCITLSRIVVFGKSLKSQQH